MRTSKFAALSFVAVATLSAAGASFAQVADYHQNGEAATVSGPAFVSTRSRADVKNEVKQAMANGELVNDHGLNGPNTPFVSVATRAEVKNETRVAMAKGELRGGEVDYSSIGQPTFVSTRSRADVVAETHQAMLNGEIHTGLAY